MCVGVFYVFPTYINDLVNGGHALDTPVRMLMSLKTFFHVYRSIKKLKEKCKPYIRLEPKIKKSTRVLPFLHKIFFLQFHFLLIDDGMYVLEKYIHTHLEYFSFALFVSHSFFFFFTFFDLFY